MFYVLCFQCPLEIGEQDETHSQQVHGTTDQTDWFSAQILGQLWAKGGTLSTCILNKL